MKQGYCGYGVKFHAVIDGDNPLLRAICGAYCSGVMHINYKVGRQFNCHKCDMTIRARGQREH